MTLANARFKRSIVPEELRDVVVQSETGSGKTLAFVIPTVHWLLQKSSDSSKNETLSEQGRRGGISRSDGTLILALAPTRELCLQITGVFQAMIMKCCPWVVCGSVCGGEKRKSEKGRIRKGINVLVATPGRALDHLLKTESFCVDKLEWLLIDEADRLFDMGFEKQISAIVDQLNLKKKASQESRPRSTILVSATITSKVLELASQCSVRTQNPVILKSGSSTKVIAHPQQSSVKLPDNLSQFFTVVHFKQRLALLSSFILTEMHKKQNSKIIVFFSTCDSVDFHTRLFQDEGGGFRDLFRSLSLHGKMAQSDRKTVFAAFGKRAEEQKQSKIPTSKPLGSVLFTTDVAARGLDLPAVDWIVQYDPPSEVSEYVHRVGRTARAGLRGKALLFLAPEEQGFLDILGSDRMLERRSTKIMDEAVHVLPPGPSLDLVMFVRPNGSVVAGEVAATRWRTSCNSSSNPNLLEIPN